MLRYRSAGQKESGNKNAVPSFSFVILNAAQRNEESIKAHWHYRGFLDASLPLSIHDAEFRRKRLYDKNRNMVV